MEDKRYDPYTGYEIKDEEHEAEIVDVDFGSVYFLWICGDQKYTGVPVWI